MSDGLKLLTEVHTVLSLVALILGCFEIYHFITGGLRKGVANTYALTAFATSVTGYFFPFEKVLPAHIVGVLSLIVLMLGGLAEWRYELIGGWRSAFVVSRVVNTYFLALVTVTQSFQKIPALHAIAPTDSSPKFQIAQLVVLAIFILLGIFSVKRFNPASYK